LSFFPAGFPPNRVSVSLLPITCHYVQPSCPPWSNYTKHISSEAEIMKLPLIQSSPSSCYCPLFRP
jgi:hypothetical protein